MSDRHRAGDRLPSLSTRAVLAALKRAGFEDAPKRGKGSHRALVRHAPNDAVHLVIVPVRKGIPAGTLRAIIKQAGLTKEEFLELL